MKNLILLFLFLILVGCKDKENIIHKSTDGSEKVYTNWFAKDENFDKPEYKEKFKQAFNQAVKQKDFNKSSELLLSVLDVSFNRGILDDDYKEVLDKYLKNHESQLFIDDVFSFYIYVGSYESNKLNYLKCIERLENVTKLEAYNFRTNVEMGYVYYYISNSYFFLGEVETALEKNEKAITCFNKTDDNYGIALVNHNKATMCNDTKNLQEAIQSIDKTINIYKKLNYNMGLVPAMINKYEYLLCMDDKKAYPYLDTIGIIINKGLIKYEQSLIQFNYLKVNKYLKEKNVKVLDQLIPIVDAQVKKINSQFWENIVEGNKSQYQLLKYNKILNKDKLLSILASYKKNKEITYTIAILNILKDEAIANNDLKKVLEYDKEIEEFDKKIQEKDFQFKVKTFEKKIDVAKKEKLIAQQKDKLKRSYIYIGFLSFSFLIFLGIWRIITLKKKRNKAIEDVKLQEQFTFQLLQNTEEERGRIASELHDSVNHDLLNIKNSLINGKTIEANDIANVIEEVRNISRNLHPAVFETIGLEASIESMCERITELGLFTTCEIEYTQKLSKNKELQLYRIIQEALNNTLKHGKANAAKVILTSQNNSLHLEVKDNGSGFDVNQQLNNSKSFGLQSIMQRAKAIAAKINIDSSTKGTVIVLKIPV
jgi:signal transduction histidine kinase